MKPCFAALAPKAIGPYSHPIRTGNLFFCSGQTPLDPSGVRIDSPDIGTQTLRAIQNLESILTAVELNLSNVVKTNVYPSDMSLFSEVNAVYTRSFRRAPVGANHGCRERTSVWSSRRNRMHCRIRGKRRKVRMQTYANVNTPATSAFTVEEIVRFRNDTRGCSQVVHFNNTGASLMPDVVTRAIAEHIELESRIGGHEASALRAEAIQQFYVQAGRLINCDSSNIVFTASATDSFVRALSAIPFRPGDFILTDNDDFISNQIQFLACQKRDPAFNWSA
jgi:reactive intermediate/imine deaminase